MKMDPQEANVCGPGNDTSASPPTMTPSSSLVPALSAQGGGGGMITTAKKTTPKDPYYSYYCLWHSKGLLPWLPKEFDDRFRTPSPMLRRALAVVTTDDLSVPDPASGDTKGSNHRRGNNIVLSSVRRKTPGGGGAVTSVLAAMANGTFTPKNHVVDSQSSNDKEKGTEDALVPSIFVTNNSVKDRYETETDHVVVTIPHHQVETTVTSTNTMTDNKTTNVEPGVVEPAPSILALENGLDCSSDQNNSEPGHYFENAVEEPVMVQNDVVDSSVLQSYNDKVKSTTAVRDLERQHNMGAFSIPTSSLEDHKENTDPLILVDTTMSAPPSKEEEKTRVINKSKDNLPTLSRVPPVRELSPNARSDTGSDQSSLSGRNTSIGIMTLYAVEEIPEKFLHGKSKPQQHLQRPETGIHPPQLESSQPTTTTTETTMRAPVSPPGQVFTRTLTQKKVEPPGSMTTAGNLLTKLAKSQMDMKNNDDDDDDDDDDRNDPETLRMIASPALTMQPSSNSATTAASDTPTPSYSQMSNFQQTLMDESGKMLQYLRKEVTKLKKQNKELKKELNLVRISNQRLMEANASAGTSFSKLNQHALALTETNRQLTTQVQILTTTQVEIKEELQMKHAAYTAEVHSRLKYQKNMNQMVDVIQEKCRDPRLAEVIFALADDCLNQPGSDDGSSGSNSPMMVGNVHKDVPGVEEASASSFSSPATTTSSFSPLEDGGASNQPNRHTVPPTRGLVSNLRRNFWR